MFLLAVPGAFSLGQNLRHGYEGVLKPEERFQSVRGEVEVVEESPGDLKSFPKDGDEVKVVRFVTYC